MLTAVRSQLLMTDTCLLTAIPTQLVMTDTCLLTAVPTQLVMTDTCLLTAARDGRAAPATHAKLLLAVCSHNSCQNFFWPSASTTHAKTSFGLSFHNLCLNFSLLVSSHNSCPPIAPQRLQSSHNLRNLPQICLLQQQRRNSTHVPYAEVLLLQIGRNRTLFIYHNYTCVMKGNTLDTKKI